MSLMYSSEKLKLVKLSFLNPWMPEVIIISYNDGIGWPDEKYFPSDVLGDDCSNVDVIFNKLFQITFSNW